MIEKVSLTFLMHDTRDLFKEANRVALEACFDAFNSLHSLIEKFLYTAHLPPASLIIPP